MLAHLKISILSYSWKKNSNKLLSHSIHISQKCFEASITVQNPGKWLTWNICTGGMGYAGYKGNMEYLHWWYGVNRVCMKCRYVLSIKYWPQYPNPRHRYHCWVGSEVLADMPGGLGGPTQYSILNTVPLDLNPRTLNIIGLGQRCWRICQGA